MSDLWKEDCNFFSGFNGRDIGMAGLVDVGSFSPDRDFDEDPAADPTCSETLLSDLGLGRRIAVLISILLNS